MFDKIFDIPSTRVDEIMHEYAKVKVLCNLSKRTNLELYEESLKIRKNENEKNLISFLLGMDFGKYISSHEGKNELLN